MSGCISDGCIRPWFCKPWNNQLHCQFVLTHFAESRLLCCRKSEVGMKVPQCYWDACVDSLMLLLTDTREQIFTKSIIEEPPFARWEAELLRGCDLPAEKVCEEVPRPGRALSVPPLGVFSLRCPMKFKTWGICTSLQVHWNLVGFR